LVFARLILEGNDYGPHIFITPIRDMKTHKPFPGIDIGDIGVKFGFNMKDNGYLAFDHYKVPRDNMLMKYSSVSKEGVYSLSPDNDPAMLYVVLLEGRINILKYSGYNLSKALTIAI
jgi:acyl-CoA oxidase